MQNRLLTIDNGDKTPYALEISHHELALRGLDPAWQGKTIVHLTDLHAGCGNIEPVFEEMVRQVQAIQPDLLLYTGDYIDRRTKLALKEMSICQVLRSLDAPMGKFGIFGNHDHVRGIVGTARLLEQADIVPLLNESLALPDGLWLAGIDDLRAGTPHTPQALERVPTDRTALVLTHNPSLFDQLPNRDLVVLAGHTHGAQVVLPFPPPALVCRLRLRCKYVAGWYTKKGNRMYVSRGIGMTRRPIRYHCPAEIVVLHLKATL